jgi:hypothetical protein
MIKTFFILFSFFLTVNYKSNEDFSSNNIKKINEELNYIILKFSKVVNNHYEKIIDPFNGFFSYKFYLQNFYILSKLPLEKKSLDVLNLYKELFNDLKIKMFRILDSQLNNYKDIKFSNINPLLKHMNQSKFILAKFFYQEYSLENNKEIFILWDQTKNLNNLFFSSPINIINYTKADPTNNFQYIIPLEIIIPYIINKKNITNENQEFIIQQYKEYNDKYNILLIKTLIHINAQFQNYLQSTEEKIININNFEDFIPLIQQHLNESHKFLNILFFNYIIDFFVNLKLLNLNEEFSQDIPNYSMEAFINFNLKYFKNFKNNGPNNVFIYNVLTNDSFFEKVFTELNSSLLLLELSMKNFITIQQKFLELLNNIYANGTMENNKNLINQSYFYCFLTMYYYFIINVPKNHPLYKNESFKIFHEKYSNEITPMMDVFSKALELMESSSGQWPLLLIGQYFPIIINNQKTINHLLKVIYSSNVNQNNKEIK